MPLSLYKKKRSFDKTPEPSGGKAAKGLLRFVIQKHDATRLHYDFRLEMEGVLKSWAVPKGPSLNPVDKRLAMMVEDHPYDYRSFEGVIPEGNYGAGPVIVWDEGTYESLEPGPKKEQEKILLKQLKTGSLKFRLNGQKLKGEFALVKLKNDTKGNAWLLIKHRDKYASETDITKKDKSVLSQKTVEGLGKKSEKPSSKSDKNVLAKKVSPKNAPVAKKAVKPSGKNQKSFLEAAEETQVKKMNGHELKFTNLDKIYWPKEKITKRDMLNYYYEAAPYMLPYLKDRPQSLNRFPNGINGESFYHKNVTAHSPSWIKMEPYTTGDGEKKNFLVPEDEAAILYMANLGAIEMNPWNSTIHKENYPDWCLIDLDPSDKNTFDQVIETALVTKEVLDNLGVKGYVKTSGSTGIHIYLPLEAKYTYDQCQLFGKVIATQVNHILPNTTSIERIIKKRKGKLYIDYLQNRPKATLAAPYSLRPKPGATVSMPLHWEEVRKGLKMMDFTIKNSIARIKNEGDIFKGVLGKGIDLDKLLANI